MSTDSMYAAASLDDMDAPHMDNSNDDPEEEEDEDGNNEEEDEDEEEEGEEEDEEVVVDGEEEEEEGEEEHMASGLSSTQNMVVTAVSNLSSLSHLREIGKEALCWQLSSAKPGNGVEQIRDGSIDSYWQSDGTKQPHWIQVHFQRRVTISHVCLYLDYALDESYTPKKIFVDYGLTNQDLQAAVYPENTEIEFQEPVGWCIVPLSSPPDPLDECCQMDLETENNNQSQLLSEAASRQQVRTHMLRISILSMHQNGRDTHIRRVELYGPRNHFEQKRVLPPPQPLFGTSASNARGNSAKVLGHRNRDDSDDEEDEEEDEDNDLGAMGFPSFRSIR